MQNRIRQGSGVPFHVQKATDTYIGDRGLSTQDLTPVIEWTVGPWMPYQTVIYRQIAPQIV